MPFAVFLRGVPPFDLEILKWPLVPEDLAVVRILCIRSEIARGVGRSRPVADVVSSTDPEELGRKDLRHFSEISPHFGETSEVSSIFSRS